MISGAHGPAPGSGLPVPGSGLPVPGDDDPVPGDDDPVPVVEGTVLWEPSPGRVARANVAAFGRWLADTRAVPWSGYEDLRRWSVEALERFWASVWDYFELGPAPDVVLARGDRAEGAHWFPGTALNYVDLVLRHPDGDLAVIACTEDGEPEHVTYGELRRRAGSLAAGLRTLGVGPGDRVGAVLTNGSAAVVAFLATASIGAVWSSCAPEFGAQSMVDRFVQIEPTVLIVADSYRYGGRTFELGAKTAALRRAMPTLKATVTVHGPGEAGQLSWDELLGTPAPLDPVRVPFEHPLWILFSSGTTGLPKPIVHGHGGIVLEHLKALTFHSDLRPADRFFWFTTTGWMMWNFLVGGLLVGCAIVCYDGNPVSPDEGRLWRLAADLGVTYFGTSAPFLEACRRAGYSPGRELPGLVVHSVGSTGAPLSPEGFAWASREVGDDVAVGSVSGGTDVCSGFVGSCPLLPVRAGELQCRMLGADVAAFDPRGHPVVGEVGELVVVQPMPSMPIGLWGDDGTRLHESYFDVFPGVWRHGDWVKLNADGSCVVYGRSDATLNRAGVRMGTAEFYRVVDALPGVVDSLVIDTSELGREGQLILFVVPSGVEPAAGSAALLPPGTVAGVRTAVREQLSPRHVPDRIIGVPRLPRTLNGKRVEVPVRRIMTGVPVDEAIATGALDDPGALDALLDALAIDESSGGREASAR